MQRALATVVLLGLLLATAAAFAITEHLKGIKSPIYATHVTKVFSPVCGCRTAHAEIGFRLRHAGTVTVKIVDSDGTERATVMADAPAIAGPNYFYWDGRTSDGSVAPEGTYQPEVELPGRTILMPNRIVVDTTAPTVLSANNTKRVFIAGGDHGLRIDYIFSGKAHAAVYLGDRRVILGRPIQPSDKVNWRGKADGKALPPGRYVLEVAAVDVAGNETPPAERKRIEVYVKEIALDTTPIHVRAGARFSVDVHTGANTYTWRLAGKHGSGHEKLLHLRAPSHRGRYRLVVSAHGYSASVLVIVGKR